MKKRTKKLVLAKETVAKLQEPELREAAGGATNAYTCGYSCGPLKCPPAPLTYTC